MSTTLQTERLLLRPITVGDAAHIYRLNSDPEVLRYLHERTLTDEADAANIITDIILPQYHLYGLGRLAMIEKSSGAFMGWCGLKLRPERKDEIDLGYRLSQPFWSKGYATEAAKACLQWGFEEKNLTEIVGRAHVDNLASLKVLQHSGMRYVQNEVVDDCPVELWSISAKEWKESIKTLNF
jgi:[ribosomal protein S5]-alanine N-acetyltransferase